MLNNKIVQSQAQLVGVYFVLLSKQKVLERRFWESVEVAFYDVAAVDLDYGVGGAFQFRGFLKCFAVVILNEYKKYKGSIFAESEAKAQVLDSIEGMRKGNIDDLIVAVLFLLEGQRQDKMLGMVR